MLELLESGNWSVVQGQEGPFATDNSLMGWEGVAKFSCLGKWKSRAVGDSEFINWLRFADMGPDHQGDHPD